MSMPESHFDSSVELLAKKKLEQGNISESVKKKIKDNLIARHICQTLSYDEAKEKLKEKKILIKEVERVKSLYKDKLSFLSFLNEKDWEIIAMIDLFDLKTFQHSIGTCLTAKNKLDRPLKGGNTFSDMIKEENITQEEFLRACLFHDIGKVAIPKFVLNSHYTDEHWAQAFIQLPREERERLAENHGFKIPEEIRKNPEKIMEYMLKNRIRGAKIVPIKALFSREQISMISSKNLSPEDSLVEMMEIHEEESEKILKYEGFEKEAILAGAHHNYKLEDRSLENADHLVSTDLIHIADIQNALENDRPYHLRKPKMKILSFIMDDAKTGVISKKTTALWIKDELDKIRPERMDTILNHKKDDINFEYLEDRKRELFELEKFLEKVLISS